MGKHKKHKKPRVIVKQSSPSLIPCTESPPPVRRGILFFDRSISTAKVVWGLLAAAITFAGAYGLLRPNLSVEPDLLLNPVDPFSTRFTVKNENSVADVSFVQPKCYTIHVITDHDVALEGLPPRPVPMIPVIGPGEKTTIACLPWLGGIGAGAGNVVTAYIEIDLTYEVSYWHWPFKPQRFPFVGAIGSDKSVHWTHITPAELQRAFAPK